MADDIDDLLDECESKFCANPSKTGQKVADKKNSSSKKELAKKDRTDTRSEGKKAARDELNEIINDICADDGLEIPQLTEPIGSVKNRKDPRSSSQTRCVKLLLGGSNFARGLCTGSEERVCNKLRCTSCDFGVLMFDDFEWHHNCDYLFFRNNVPDFDKLKSKLTRRKGCCAYACQCSWRSITQLIDLWSSESQLKWVCGKHSS